MKITYEENSIEIQFEEGDTVREGRVVRAALELVSNLLSMIKRK